MVEFFHDTQNQTCVCKTDKMLSTITISKEIGGYCFFVVTVEQGSVPTELGGRYSSIPKAQTAVEQYLKTKRKSATVRRNEFSEDFDKRKKVKDAAKSRSKGNK